MEKETKIDINNEIKEKEEKEEKEEDIIISNNMKWQAQHETILVGWSDNSMIYSYLHSKEHKQYQIKNIWYTIPVIIISTVTGTANFAISRVPDEYRQYAEMTIGAFNLLVGIISTIKQFLKIAQLNEAHRVAALAWSKYHRNIKIELIKSPEERIPVNQMLKMCKEEYDRLIETSPDITDKTLKDFKTKFKNNKEYAEIVKPEICDSLIPTRNFKYVKEKEIVNLELQKKQKKRRDTIKKKKLEELNTLKENKIIKFSNNFKLIRGRNPFVEEINDNLKSEFADIDTFIKNNNTMSNYITPVS